MRKEDKQASNEKKPIIKRLWFKVVVGLFVLGVIGSFFGSGEEEQVAQNEAPPQEETEQVAKEEETTKVEDDIPMEYKSALKSAENYGKMNMSKQGIYDQLTSEFDQFTPEAAEYAIENVKVDWNENALKSGKVYQEDMAMSKAAIYDQLISEYGDAFAEEQAQYAINNLPD